MPEADKVFGKMLPDTINPPERVCFVIEIPDTLQYRAALMGQLEWLADWRCWEHEGDAYTDPPADNLEAAQLFAIAVTDARFEDCMDACERVAQCLIDGDETLINALATAISQNPVLLAAISGAITEQGGSVPGQPLTSQQSAQSILPPEVFDEEGNCIDDNLWGACLYLVQSGNRAITDFFEVLENASNTLEASAIISQNIPAAGSYAASAAEFADQLLENFQEGYAAAYTEEFENDLACALFCLAREDCELTPDMLNSLMASRLPDAVTFITFEAVMNYMGAGTFVPGAVIADAMFAIYFTALQFGQEFGQVAGFRPLTDLMSLGADQLASDNWEVLCDCPSSGSHRFDFTIDEQGWLIHAPYGAYVAGVGFNSNVSPLAWLYRDWTGATNITAVRFETSAGNQLLAQVATPEPALTTGIFNQPGIAYTDTTIDTSGIGGFMGITQIVCRPGVDGVTTWTGTITAITLYWEGTEPTF